MSMIVKTKSTDEFPRNRGRKVSPGRSAKEESSSKEEKDQRKSKETKAYGFPKLR